MTMKGFFIDVTNNLLEKKHRKTMKIAVWEFMWCLDKITMIDEQEVGWVLGGRPIKLEDIRKDLGTSLKSISQNLSNLHNAGYIEVRRVSNGLIIKVFKAKKRFNKKVKSDLTKASDLNVENDGSSIQGTVDNNSKTENGAFSEQDRKELIDLFKDVNPNHEILFGRTNQADALARMFNKFGRERLEAIIKMLPLVIVRPGSPQITTPLQLEAKMGQLIAFVKQQNGKVGKSHEIAIAL